MLRTKEKQASRKDSAQVLSPWERGTLSSSLIWVSLPLASNSPLNLGCRWGPGVMAVTVCAGPGEYRGSIHGGNRSLAPRHTPMLKWEPEGRGEIPAVTYSVNGRTEVPIPPIMLPFFSSFFPSTLRSQGEVSPSARLHGLRQDTVGENCLIPGRS